MFIKINGYKPLSINRHKGLRLTMTYLYYYTDCKNASRIKESRVLTGSPVNNTNDPHEGIPAVAFARLYSSIDNKMPNENNYYYSLAHKLQEMNLNFNSKYLCLSRNHPADIFAPAMWRRYTKTKQSSPNGLGSCFVVDFKTNLYKRVSLIKDYKIHHGAIIYKHYNQFVEGRLNGSINPLPLPTSPLGIKDASWFSEREYRFIWHPDVNDAERSIEHPELDRSLYEIVGEYTYSGNDLELQSLSISFDRWHFLSLPKPTMTIHSQNELVAPKQSLDLG